MSINLAGRTLTLNTSNATTAPGIGAAAALLSVLSGEGNTNQSLTTEEGSIAYANKDTTQKYQKLRSIGLNNLRSEIVSICEFIPLSSDNNEDSAKIMFRHGENTQLRVTNVSRLIELQRQIRTYLLTAAEKILENVYTDLYKAEFIEQLKTRVKQHAKNLTVEQAKNMQTFTQSFFDLLRGVPGEFSETVTANQSNPFLLATIEYIAGDVLIEAVVEYISSVTTLSDNLNKHYGVFQANNIFSPQSSFSSTTPEISSAQTFLDVYTEYKPSIDPAWLTGREFKGEHSHTDQLSQLLKSIGSAFYHLDSSEVLQQNYTTAASTPTPHRNDLRYQRGDLYNSLKLIKNIHIAGCTSYYPSNANQYLFEQSPDVSTIRLAGLGVEKPAGNNMARKSDMTKIFNRAISTSPGTYTDYGHGELVAAMCFDTFSFWASNNFSNFETSPHSIGTTTGLNKNNTGQFRERDNIVNWNDSTYDQTAGEFGSNFMGLRDSDTGTGETVRYAPLEGTNKEGVKGASAGNDIYQTGLDYFISTVLTRTNFEEESPDFSELANFVEEYKAGATNLYAEVMTRNPPHTLVSTVNPGSTSQKVFAPVGRYSPEIMYKNLLSDLKSDIENIRDTLYDDSPSLPALMLFLITGYTSGHENHGMPNAAKHFVTGFNATWWASVLQNGAYWGKGLGDDSQDAKSEDSLQSTHQIIGHLINYYYEDMVIDFFEGALNTPLKDGALNKKRSFPSVGGAPVVEYSSPLSDRGNMVKELDQLSGVQDISGGGLPSVGSNYVEMSQGDRNTGSSYKKGNIDRTFDRSLGDQDTNFSLLKVTEGDLSDNQRFGFLRLIHKSFTKATTCGAISASTSGKLSASPLSEKNFKSTTEISNFLSILERTDGHYILNSKNSGFSDSSGGTLQLNAQHRGLIWYGFVHDLLYSCIRITMSDGGKDGINFGCDSKELTGIIDALSAAIDNADYDDLSNYNSRSLGEGATSRYRKVKEIAYSKLMKAFDAIRVRQKKISHQTLTLVNHADFLSTFTTQANNVIAGRSTSGNEKPLTSLGINVLTQNNILSDSLTLSTRDTASNAQAQRFKNYSLKKQSLFPNFVDIKLGKVKLMHKVLAQPGYGLLPTEKRGNKSIIHVGLPLGMIEALQRFGFEEQQDGSFLDSPYICISIFKEDHLNPTMKFYPKNFIFDTSARILDIDPDTGEYFDHASSFDENKNFDQVLKSINITRFLQTTNEDGTKSGNIVLKKTKGYPGGIFDKNVLINHVQDYCFKEYFRLTNSLEFDESFLKFFEQDNNMTPSGFVGNASREEYLRVLDKIRRLYPDVNTDTQLASEVFRLAELLKQTAPFSFSKNFKSVISPNAFDRIYSVVVNEKDFIPKVPDSTLSEMFEGSVNFGSSGKLERPDSLSLTYEGKLNDGLIQQQSPDLYRYAQSIDENFPGVYQYYAQVSLLPVNFRQGADLSRVTIGTSTEIGSKPVQVRDSSGKLIKERVTSTNLNFSL